MRTVIIAAPTINLFDAIGTDILVSMCELQASQMMVRLYAPQFAPELAELMITREECQALLGDPRNVLVYHFGIYWEELPTLLSQVRCPVVVKYHNVTPPEFFTGWDEVGYHATFAAKAQIIWLVNHPQVALVLSASRFNLFELVSLVGHYRFRSAVLPPFMHTSDLESNSRFPLLKANTFHILFVGRLVPNKGHIHLIQTLKAIVDADPTADYLLHLVGKQSHLLIKYMESLRTMISDLDLEDHVHFWQEVDSRQLKQLYRESSLFMCLSDHEGFCVPIIEAQSHGLPVLTWDQGALGDTAGWGLGTWKGPANYTEIAHLALKLMHDQDFRAQCVAEGTKNASFYKSHLLGRQLYHYLKTV